MLRVFHLPSHLSYASKLTHRQFVTAPSPSGASLRVADLVALPSWDFFDVLHLHSVELTSSVELALLAGRLKSERKGFVFTVHDLVPNIETDVAAFDEKTRVVLETASRVITLTRAAAGLITSRFDATPSVIPHGFALHPTTLCPDRLPEYLVLGALRTNRDLLGLVRAWRTLPGSRPQLRVLLRSLKAADRLRYAYELIELNQASASEPDLIVETSPHVLSPAELTERCRHARVLVLPYRSITHSGQLELARDLGIAVVVPNVPTVRAQLSETNGETHPCAWFPVAALGNPDEFAEHLVDVSRLTLPNKRLRDDFAQFRTGEHESLLDQYAAEYHLSYEQR